MRGDSDSYNRHDDAIILKNQDTIPSIYFKFSK